MGKLKNRSILKLVSKIILLVSVGNLAELQVGSVRQSICRVTLKSNMIKEFPIVNPAEKHETPKMNLHPTASC